MGEDPFRDLHDASLFTNSTTDTFREYHHRRLDTHRTPSSGVKGVEHGVVVAHVSAPGFLDNVSAGQIDTVVLQDEYEKWPMIARGDRPGERSNIDHRGIVAVKEDPYEDRQTVTRIDRHGILESVSTTIFTNRNQSNDTSLLTAGKLEQGLVETVGVYIDRVRNGLQEDTLVTISYANLENVRILRNNVHPRNPEIGVPLVRTPVISLGADNIREELEPVIKPLWNAVGDWSSPHMKDGEWEYDPNRQFDW